MLKSSCLYKLSSSLLNPSSIQRELNKERYHIYIYRERSPFREGERKKKVFFFCEEMSKEEVIILDCSLSPFCSRIKIALNEKGVSYECREEDLFGWKGGKSDLLLKSNPIYKKVPVLLHNDKPLNESSIIVNYIDETWPSSSPLLPSSPYERAQARFWIDYIDKKVCFSLIIITIQMFNLNIDLCIVIINIISSTFPLFLRIKIFSRLFSIKVFEAGSKIWQSNGEEQENAKKDLIEILKELDGALGDKDFFGGEKFGIVDVIAIPFTGWLYAFEEVGKFKIEEHCPQFSAWEKRCLLKVTVANVIPCPHKVYQFVTSMRKNLGLE